MGEELSELSAKLRSLKPKDKEPNSAQTLTGWIAHAERDLAEGLCGSGRKAKRCCWGRRPGEPLHPHVTPRLQPRGTKRSQSERHET
jgi:hypothetical protein